jgi:hypothetical protein
MTVSVRADSRRIVTSPLSEARGPQPLGFLISPATFVLDSGASRLCCVFQSQPAIDL